VYGSTRIFSSEGKKRSCEINRVRAVPAAKASTMTGVRAFWKRRRARRANRRALRRAAQLGDSRRIGLGPVATAATAAR